MNTRFLTAECYSVALYIIEETNRINKTKTFKEEKIMSASRLTRLLYFCDVLYMKINEGKSLFIDNFNPWPSGPTITGIYDEFNDCISFKKKKIPIIELSEKQKKIIKEVVEATQDLETFDLENVSKDESYYQFFDPTDPHHFDIIPKKEIYNFYINHDTIIETIKGKMFFESLKLMVQEEYPQIEQIKQIETEIGQIQQIETKKEIERIQQVETIKEMNQIQIIENEEIPKKVKINIFSEILRLIKQRLTLKIEKEDQPIILKEQLSKDSITLKLENVEYLLALVKLKDKNKYEEFLKEYNEMVDSETQVLTLCPLTVENLTLLESKIESYLDFSKNDINNILEVLNNLKNSYLENLFNGSKEKTKLTISYIDKLNRLFLKTKGKYTVREQQLILKNISFLYMMEIMEDSNIKVSDLENSYFKDNLKCIVTIIMSLIENEIIENNIIIDYEIDLDIYSVFNIIKSIEFKKQKQKVLNLNFLLEY